MLRLLNIVSILLTMALWEPDLRAQEGSPVFKLKTRMDGEDLGKNLLLREDPEHALSMEEILDLDDASFQVSESSIPNFGFNQSTMWVRFYLENTGQKPKRVILEYGYPSADKLDLFYQDKAGKLQSKLNGDRRPVGHREIAYRLPSFSIVVPPGVHPYHLRLQTEGVSRVPLKIWSVASFQDKRSNEMAFLAFLYGFLFVMMFYNIFVALMTQHKGYAFYVLFIAVSILHHAGAQGVFMAFLPSRWAIPLSNEIYILCTGLGICFSSLFTISFLNISKHLRSFYFILLFSTALGVTVCAVTPFNYNLAAKISTVSALIVALSILGASLIRCLQRFRPAYFFMMAWLISIAGTLASNLSHSEILDVNFFTNWGGFIGVAVEVVLLSLAMGDKMKLAVENSARAIRELNESLERKVEEKTRDIRSILANIKIGICTIVSQDLLVDREYSASLEEIFEQKNLAGTKALDLIFGKSSLSQNEIALMESTLLSAMGEDPLQFDTNAHTLVREIHIKDRQGSIRTLEIDWSIMQDKGGEVEKILVTCRDVTEIRRFQATMQVQQKELDYIGELVANSAAKTETFFHSVHRFMEENGRLIQSNSVFQAEVLKILFINMHTIKGSARTLGFRDLASLAHDMEQDLVAVQRKNSPWNQQSLWDDHQQLLALVRTYERINKEKIGRSQQTEGLLQLKRSDFNDDLALLDVLEQSSDLRLMKSNIIQLRNRLLEKVFHSGESFFQDVTMILPQLALDLGKAPPLVHCQADGILFTSEAIEALDGAFVHILRNIMDHGIETPADRLAAGKESQGNIDIYCEERAAGLTVYVADDGRGLAIRKIEELAKERGLIGSNVRLDSQHIAQLIFESGFSTRKHLSEISGRGVGMDAVRQFLESLGGHASIQLLKSEDQLGKDHIPFRLCLHIPAAHYRRLILARAN